MAITSAPIQLIDHEPRIDRGDPGGHAPARRRPSLEGSDLRWYGLSVAISLSGAILQVAVPQAREGGLAVLVLAAGLFVGLLRLLLQRQAKSADVVAARFDRLEESLGVAPLHLVEDGTVSRLAPRLWQDEERRHHERLAAIREGAVAVRGREATVRALRSLTEEAHRSVHAVDLADITDWLEDTGLNDYLTFQLQRSAHGEISLERIRVVHDSELQDPHRRELLERFVEMHEQARASILLCPARELEMLATVFGAQGMALMDRGENAACVMGRVGAMGHLEGANVYLKGSSPLRSAINDYDRIKEHIVRLHLDEGLRERLAEEAANVPSPNAAAQ